MMSFNALTFGRLRDFGAADKIILLVSVVCSLIYFITLNRQPYPGSVVLKAASIASLAVLAFKLLRETKDQSSGVARVRIFLRDRDNLILGAALSFSCLGDIYLDLDPGRFFVNGLFAFLVAHFIYILLFVRNWQRPLRPTGNQMLLGGLVLIYSLLFSYWLAPSLGDLARPVMFYVCAITAMVVTAIFADFSKPWVWLGAVLFLISDSIIAADKFKMDLPLRDYLVWATYYLGQYGIAIGFIREKLGKK
jgi:uncharacterized membrane protein YhhN